MSTTTHNKVKSKSHSITVSKNFKPTQGEKIGSKYVLGDKLGEGMYGAVYDIITQQQQNDDNSVGLVFKCLKVGQQSEKHGLLREWLINEKLNQLDHSEGFMYAEVGVYREDGKFIGMILEKMNGWTVRKRIKQKKFHDIDYICFMLQDVFEALQQSQIQLGFHHADLHLGNIMEQHPCTPNTILNRSKSKKWTITGLSYDVNLNKIDAYDLQNVRFKMIDFGHSWFFNRKNQELAEISQIQKFQQKIQQQQFQVQQQQQIFEQSEKNNMIDQSQKQSTEIQKELQSQQHQEQQLKEKQEIQVFFLQNLLEQLYQLQFLDLQEISYDALCQQLKIEQYQNMNLQQSINQENQLIHKQQQLQEEFQQQTYKKFQTPFENPDQEFDIWNEPSGKNCYHKKSFIQIFVISKSIIQTHEKNFLYIQQKRCVQYFQIPENQNLIIMVVWDNNYSSQDKKKLLDENNINKNLTKKLRTLQQEFFENSQKEIQKYQQYLYQNFEINSIEQIMQKIFQKIPQNLNSNNKSQQNQNPNSEIQNNLSSGFSNRKKFEFPSQQFELSNAEMHGWLNLELMHSEQPNSNSAILLRTSCTEKVYRIFWRGKGDVYRVLLSLAAQIDCNIWDKKDQQLVEGVRKLIYCVLGIKIQRKYEENLDQKLRGFGQFSLKSSKFQTGWYRWGRRLRIRTHALLIPSRAGILAKDALALWQKIQTQITLQPGEK